MTLLLIIALSWYAKQGQNNPFIPVSVVKLKTIGNITALEFYKKKGKEIYHRSIFPLTYYSEKSSKVNDELKNYKVFGNFTNNLLKNQLKKECLEFIELDHLKKNNLPSYNEISLIYSEPLHSLGLNISKIYISNKDSSIATVINRQGISFIVINDLEILEKRSVISSLKEKFMIAIISDSSLENAQKLRNILRPEHLIVINDNEKDKAVQNILFINSKSELKISRSLNGTVRIRDLKP